MSLHYTLMGNTRKGQSQRVYHGQSQAVRQEDTQRDPEKERLKNSLHGENAHVRDCLVWQLDDGSNQEGSYSPRSPRRGEPVKRTPRENEFSITNYKSQPRHPELGRARNHLYGEDGPPDLHPKPKSTEGGVAEAMYGWPQQRRLEEERQGRSGVGWEFNVREDAKPKTIRRKQRIEDGDSEAVMDELISHRYLRDNEERLRELREKQVLDQATAHRNRHNFRDNKTSILRAEAINGGAGTGREDPKDLWKMPRFTNAAKSRLNDCPQCKKRHDCYHEDGRGFPNDSSRPECKKCSKGTSKGMGDKEMGDESGNRPQEGSAECVCQRPCPCCQQHHQQKQEEYPYYEHQQPEKLTFREEDYSRSGLVAL